MTSLPVWAMNVSYLCDSIGYYMVLNAFPLYLREVLKYDVQAVSISTPMTPSIQAKTNRALQCSVCMKEESTAQKNIPT